MVGQQHLYNYSTEADLSYCTRLMKQRTGKWENRADLIALRKQVTIAITGSFMYNIQHFFGIHGACITCILIVARSESMHKGPDYDLRGYLRCKNHRSGGKTTATE